MDRKRKILIVDDELDLLTCLKVRLEASNFEVIAASSKDEALKEAEKGPDVILLDIMMPEGSEGYWIFSNLKSNILTRDIPVIFLSRKTEDREKVLGIGASYFLIKPFESKELLEKIALAINGEKESSS